MKQFKKICKKCEKLFQPGSKYNRICEKCNQKHNKPLAIEYWIMEFIQNLKNKTTVTIADLEKFNEKAMNVLVAIEALRDSRNNWRIKYEELKNETQMSVSR